MGQVLRFKAGLVYLRISCGVLRAPLHPKGITDPAEAECIARDILGERYKALGSMNLKNVLHFMKFVEKKETESRK